MAQFENTPNNALADCCAVPGSPCGFSERLNARVGELGNEGGAAAANAAVLRNENLGEQAGSA